MDEEDRVLPTGELGMVRVDVNDSFAWLRTLLTEVIGPLIPKFDGNIFKQTGGDLVLIEFDSVVEATRCAAALRDQLAPHNQRLANEQRITMRIGINLGDIICRWRRYLR